MRTSPSNVCAPDENAEGTGLKKSRSRESEVRNAEPLRLQENRDGGFNPNSEVRPRSPHEHRWHLAGSEELVTFWILRVFGRERGWFLLIGNTGGSGLFWKEDHAEFCRLGSEVLDFGFLIFGFVVLHALVHILGSILEHSVEKHS